MVPKFREWDAEREDIMPGKGMSYGTREDSDDAFLIRFDHMEDLALVNNDGSIDRVVMMSTGLKDKNGVEIFEGDVIKYDSVPNPFLNDNHFEIIQARSGEWRIDNYRGGQVLVFSNHVVEIIGNKYEHPHLLEE